MSEESFKIVITKDLEFPNAPHGFHPYDCQSDCSYCDSMGSYEEACERIIEEAVEELEDEFDADVEHLSDTHSAKENVLYWLNKIVKDTERSVQLAKERKSKSMQHYGKSIVGVPLDHSESVIKALKTALQTAKHQFYRAEQ